MKTAIRVAALAAALFTSMAHAQYGSRAQPGAMTDQPQAMTAPAVLRAPAVASINEGFDDITLLAGAGWFIQNNSTPVGSISWFQGTATNATPTPGPFNSYQGALNSYIAVNFNSTGSTGTISNWLVTPEMDFGGNTTLTFYTRKPTIGAGQTDYPDRLQVRLSTNGGSTNVGTGASGVGDFTTVLLEINPTLTINVYPQVWTQYTITNANGLPRSGTGRVAFRYFVTGAGALGSNSDYIGIDSFAYNAGAPEFRVGGAVTGLAGSGLSLTLNGGTPLPIGGNGAFQFPDWVPTGTNYTIAVSGQPALPAQTCTVTNDTGTVSADVNNIQVNCTTKDFALSIVSGDLQTTNVGVAFAETLVVKLVDGDGAALAGRNVSFQAPIDGASAVLEDGVQAGNSSLTVQTGGDGLAVVSATANGAAGCYGVLVTAPGASQALAFELNNFNPVPEIFMNGFETPPVTLKGLTVCGQ